MKNEILNIDLMPKYWLLNKNKEIIQCTQIKNHGILIIEWHLGTVCYKDKSCKLINQCR